MNTDYLIDQLSADAAPVRPLSLPLVRLALVATALGTILLTLAFWGPRPQLLTGTADAVTLLLAALLGLLAIAAGLAATRLARPAVGGVPGGGLWLFGAILLFPAIALVQQLLGHDEGAQSFLGIYCLASGLGMSLFTAAFLTLHLRRGAPVLPERAGLLAGIASGAVGALAITLECGGSTFAHLALWHVAIVAAWALVGRTLLARLIRW
ncbi:NrsF family protein [Sphingomicrobium arenosum]|uniref:NrsF family protein n=1 Tax=Sphingomicrobium arenosum TaxID=2233861 RepID=UPI002240D96C|nr:NrsF family protein [Sphingomicrobium arenosum]